MFWTHSSLKRKTDMHWARKIWHMTGVSLIALIVHLVAPFWAGIGLIVLWLMFVPFDIIRLRFPALNEFALHVFGPIMRQSESNRWAGTSFLCSGILLTYWLVPREVFMLTLLYLAFADPIASIVGIRYGKDKIFGHKSLQGSFAAFTVCAFLTFFFLNYNGMMLDRAVIVSLLGGLIGCLAEAVPIGQLDDNFTIPVLSAAGLWTVFSIFGALTP